jgi:hypothetical protein
MTRVAQRNQRVLTTVSPICFLLHLYMLAFILFYFILFYRTHVLLVCFYKVGMMRVHKMRREVTIVQSILVVIHFISLYFYIYFFLSTLYTKLTFPWGGTIPLHYR